MAVATAGMRSFVLPGSRPAEWPGAGGHWQKEGPGVPRGDKDGSYASLQQCRSLCAGYSRSMPGPGRCVPIKAHARAICNAPSPFYLPCASTWEPLPLGSRPRGCPGEQLEGLMA